MPNPAASALIRLIYVSAATLPWLPGELERLLEKSRRNNQALGVTGILVTCEQQFFQVLEGPRAAVLALFQRICSDDRHAQVVTLMHETLEERTFAEWSMAHTSLSSAELQATAHVDTLLDLRSGLNTVQGLMVRALLNAFIEQTRSRMQRLTAVNLPAKIT